MLKDLTDILIEQKVIQKNRLEELKLDAQAENKSILQYLEEKKIVRSEDIAKAYSHQFNIPYIEKITEDLTEPDLLGKIPFKFLRENNIIPLKIKDDQITIATSNPNNFRPIDELNILLGGNVNIAVATSATIIDAINRFYPIEGTKKMFEELGEEKELAEEAIELGEIEEKDILAMAQEAPIIKLVNHILFQAVKRNASDVHIEPFEKEIRVRYRIDGVLHEVFSPPKRIQGALISRIKIMANLNIAEKRMPQDGRIEIKVADKPFDIRVSILPATFGEKIVMRLLDKSRTFGKITGLGLTPKNYEIIQQAMHMPNGIILITGPTGSGKTSTLYSILNELNTPEKNIITAEDPVEYQIFGITQVQVSEKIGRTFAMVLRSILRQDPDIIMIGEIRDNETAQIAIQSSLTGHLVLSTLHTNSAAATITRMIDMGLEPFLISSTVTCIVAQRLVRKLCPFCKKQYTPDAEELRAIRIKPEQIQGVMFYKAIGCNECTHTGYKGRLAIFEVMQMSPAIALLTKEKSDAEVIEKQAQKEGMRLLVQDGFEKIKEGLTTIEEVLSVAVGADVLE